jgi:Signal transduction histidine kinase
VRLTPPVGTEVVEVGNDLPSRAMSRADPFISGIITPEEGWLLQREKLLAWLRLAFAIVAIAVVQLNPSRTIRFPTLSVFSLWSFLIYSLLILELVRRQKITSKKIGIITACLDSVWIFLIVFSTGGTRTPFFFYFSFPILSASLRWGIKGSVLVALVVVGLYGLIRFSMAAESFERPMGIDTLLVRSIYLIILAYIFGFISDFEKKQNQRLLALSDTAIKAAAIQERRRITYEIHDGILQSLATIILRLESCRSRLLDSQDELHRDIEGIENFTRTSMTEIRNFLAGKDTQPFTPGTLIEKLREEMKFLQESLGLEVILESEPEDPSLPNRVEREVYYALREALANVTKHSHASRAEIRITQTPNLLQASLKDNGVGFDQDNRRNRSRLGLSGMEDRIKKTGGRLSIKSSPGLGTTVSFAVPLMETKESIEASMETLSNI